MSKRNRFVCLNVEGAPTLFSVKHVVVTHEIQQDEDMFICEHCDQPCATRWFENVQYGFYDDLCNLVCYCSSCGQLSEFQYKRKVK